MKRSTDRFAIPLVGLNADYFAGCTREDMVRSPLFTSFDDARMSSTNALNIVDYGLRAKMLGDAIPAESFAAGANAIVGFEENYNFQSAREIPNGWPRTSNDWRHSDLKDVSYYYVWKLFEKIVGGE